MENENEPSDLPRDCVCGLKLKFPYLWFHSSRLFQFQHNLHSITTILEYLKRETINDMKCFRSGGITGQRKMNGIFGKHQKSSYCLRQLLAVRLFSHVVYHPVRWRSDLWAIIQPLLRDCYFLVSSRCFNVKSWFFKRYRQHISVTCNNGIPISDKQAVVSEVQSNNQIAPLTCVKQKCFMRQSSNEVDA